MGELLELTEENVERIMNECMHKPNSDIANIIPISAVVQYYSFDYNEIQSHKEQITYLFSQLEDRGLKRTITMLLLRMDGKPWTKSLKMLDGLIGLGLANDDIEFYYPRELWKVLPNKEPVILIKKEKEVELTTESLTEVYDDCIITPGVNLDNATLLIVEGVSGDYTFDLNKLEKHTSAIISFIKEVVQINTIEQFKYFFTKNTGLEWTKDINDVERLVALGLAIGMLEFEHPRELWGDSEKKSPNIVVRDPLTKILSSNIN